MTISSTTSRNDYIGNGATSVYPYTFKIFAKTDLRVTKRDTGNLETTLVVDTDYTVSGVGAGTGGSITLTAGNLTTGYALTIRRVRPVTQTTDLRNQGESFRETNEDAFDHGIMVAQQQKDELDRSIKLPETEAGSASNTTIPSAAARAGMVLGFDSSGNPAALVSIPTSSLAVSAFMTTMLDDANAAAARGTLLIDGSGGGVGGVIAAGDIKSDAVTTSKILDANVTTAKIADSNVTFAKLAAAVQQLWKYKRPVLQWISVNTVDVENNSGTADETTIIFPDGEVRTVVENTAFASKFRRFIITENAEFTAGTENSGLRSGLAEANNTWYALYAVKSQINSANFVLVGDTTLPSQANYSTLNSRYGTNGWVYLGMIRNGDNSGATGDILNFAQEGHFTKLINTGAFAGARPSNGTLLASGSSVASVSYAYAAGTGAAQIPAHILAAIVHAVANVGSAGLVQFTDSAAAFYFGEWYSTATGVQTVVAGVAAGFKLAMPASSNGAIFLGGFFDSVLGVGPNPTL